MLLLHSPNQPELIRPIADTARALGWDVYAPKSDWWHIPKEVYVNRPDVAIYGDRSFCWLTGNRLGYRLLDNPPGWLATLPIEYLNHEVKQMKLGEACKLKEPKFVRSLTSSFSPGVYTGERLKAVSVYHSNTDVLVSDPLSFTTRYRVLVRNHKPVSCCSFDHAGMITSCQRYWYDQDKAISLVDALLQDKRVACVDAIAIDVGRVQIDHRLQFSYHVIGSKPVWTTNLYGSERVAALHTIKAACIKNRG